MSLRPALAALLLAAALALASAQPAPWCGASVCFALTGTNADSFAVQKTIIRGFLFTVSPRGGVRQLAAVQASGSGANTAISPLTAMSDRFLTLLDAATPNFGDAAPVAALSYCFAELLPGGRPAPGPARRAIVVLGAGTDPDGRAARRAGLFGAVGGKMFAVGTNGADWMKLNALSGNAWRTLVVGGEGRGPWQTGVELANRLCRTELPLGA